MSHHAASPLDHDYSTSEHHRQIHHHGPPPAATPRTTKIVTAVLIPAALLTALGLILLWPSGLPTPPSGDGAQRAYGEVVRVVEAPCPPQPPGFQPPPVCGTVEVNLTDGPGKGGSITVDVPSGPGAPTVNTGDAVILVYTSDAIPGVAQYAITDHQRGRPMVLMLVLCAGVLIAFARWRGLTAILGLAVSFAALLLFVIPAILTGEPPLLVAIVGAAAIMFAVLYLTHGVNVHTSVAVLGTLASLVLTGLLGYAFTVTTRLTGFGSEETLYLSIMQTQVDVRGLLLAGIIIGALGVLDDVTVTQATTVAELSPTATSRLGLYQSAIRVGRAHIASAVNTIVLAYAGASLPLLILLVAGGRDVSDLLTSEFLAEEIVRSAVGTIGLVAAVPITSALAALVANVGTTAPEPPGARGHHRRRWTPTPTTRNTDPWGAE